MSRDSFFDVGNLAEAPLLRFVNVGTEKRAVADMRIYCAKYFRDAAGELKERADSFWINVSLWGSKGERAAKLLTKGARVCVVGELGQQKWVDKETGEQKFSFTVTASDVFLDLSRVSNIHWQERQSHSSDIAQPAMDLPPMDAYEDMPKPSEATPSTVTEPAADAKQPGKRNKGMKEVSETMS